MHFPIYVTSQRNPGNKQKFSGPNCVLIDDRGDLREAWEARGGIFIHHTEAKESIRQLRGQAVLSIENEPLLVNLNAGENIDEFEAKFRCFSTSLEHLFCFVCLCLVILSYRLHLRWSLESLPWQSSRWAAHGAPPTDQRLLGSTNTCGMFQVVPGRFGFLMLNVSMILVEFWPLNPNYQHLKAWDILFRMLYCSSEKWLVTFLLQLT